MESPHLPARPTELVGRDAELERLVRLLDNGRIVTLAGLGGVGKTRLALECAHAFAARDGRAAWVDLSPATDETTIRAQIARALDMRGVPAEAFAREVAARADLIVLDRCEDIAADVARLALGLAAESDALEILVTSRVPVDGIPAMSVEPLGLESEGGAHADAVRLFLERALAANARFRVDDRALQNVSRICALLGGIPLAIEVAASYAPYIDVADLAERLGDGTLSDVAGPIATILGWSYDHLDDDARAVLRRIALYEGPFRFVDAEAAAAVPAVRIAIERLTAASLLGAAASDDGLARFRLADPVREFARARLSEANETRDTLARIVSSLARSAEEIDRRIAAGDPAALGALPGAFAPVLSALTLAVSFGQEILTDACRLAGSITPHLIRIGYQADLREPLARLVDAAGVAETDLGEPYDRLLEAAAFLANRMGELDVAVALNDRRIARARASGSIEALARAIATSTQAVLHSNRIERAEAFAVELARLAPGVRDRGLLARVYRGLGQLAFATKNFEDAKRFYEAFLDLGPDAAPKSMHTIVLHDYGASLAYLGDIDAGQSYIEACIEAATEADPSTAAHALASKAYWYLEREQCEEAQDALRRAVALFSRGINVVTQYYILEMYVAASLRDDQAEALCFILGFVERGRELLGFKATQTDAARINSTTNAVRSRAGAAPAHRAFAAGRLASLEEALARVEQLRPGAVSVKRFERFAGLSNREREIAERVGAGKTNRQIADELFVSVRTVDHHVASIFRKLGIQKREELE